MMLQEDKKIICNEPKIEGPIYRTTKKYLYRKDMGYNPYCELCNSQEEIPWNVPRTSDIHDYDKYLLHENKVELQ